MNELIVGLEAYGELNISEVITALTVVGFSIGTNNALISEIFDLLDKREIIPIKYYINKNSIKILVPSEISLSTLELLHNAIILKNVNFE